MKRILVISLIFFLGSFASGAQEIKYPREVKDIFEKADAEITESYGKPWVKGNLPLADKGLSIRIAVPDCEESEHLKEMAKIAGCEPVDIPAMSSMTTPSVDLRALAGQWDGALLPDGWVSSRNEYSVLVYKTIAEWNIPCMGSSSLTDAIDKGLRRMPNKISSLDDLLKKARLHKEAVRLMEGIFSVDTHCDLPDDYSKGRSVGKRTVSQCSIPKMDEGGLDSQVLISFLWQGATDDASSRRAVEKNIATINKIKEDIARYPDHCGLATTPAEAETLRKQGRKAFFIALENGYGIGNDIGNIKKMKDLGIVYITLCHFNDNAICNTSSKKGSDPSKGLTEYGREVIEEMNRQGIMIDLSHPSSGTFWDCIKYSKAPIICSHSGAKAVYGHDRGLDDKQLKALAENGGVIQVYTVPEFLGPRKDASNIDDMMRHFNHCVEVAGAEHVGIGSDFDGGGGVWGCNGDNDLINVTMKMLEHGYTAEQIKGFWGGNFLRVMREVQSIGDRD